MRSTENKRRVVKSQGPHALGASNRGDGVAVRQTLGVPRSIKVSATLPQSVVTRTETRRQEAAAALDPERRGQLGQFFTPAPVADLLAAMFDAPAPGRRLRLLDPGAGVGSLTAAVAARAADERWGSIIAHVFELDGALLPYLQATMTDCEGPLGAPPEIEIGDFIAWATRALDHNLFGSEFEPYDLAILNPPYRKLATDSRERRLLASVGIDATNLYAAFVALAMRLLRPGGQLVAITPRSFCNGPYFRPFRRSLLEQGALRRVHVFESRDSAFRDADVLQENVIYHVVKGADAEKVSLSISDGLDHSDVRSRVAAYSEVVRPGDREAFIHLAIDQQDRDASSSHALLPARLADLGVQVSTGRVVDFRASDHLRDDPADDTVPLIYPLHLLEGRLRWPVPGARKANALARNELTAALLLPMGAYVLVKRFTSKEQPRRVVAAMLLPDDLATDQVAIENHINVYHRDNGPLPPDLAWGLCVYLNSTVVDTFFRQFNGHTQVNATDLRSLRYPSANELRRIGELATNAPSLDADLIDRLVEEIMPVAAEV